MDKPNLLLVPEGPPAFRMAYWQWSSMQSARMTAGLCPDPTPLEDYLELGLWHYHNRYNRSMRVVLTFLLVSICFLMLGLYG